MKFVYSPEGADPQEWVYDPDRIMNAEAEAIERKTGMPFATWAEQLLSGSALAAHALLWVYLKRDRPTLKWEEVTFCMAEIALDFDDDETEAARQGLAAKAATEGLSDGEAELLERLGGIPAPDPLDTPDLAPLPDPDADPDDPAEPDPEPGPKADGD